MTDDSRVQQLLDDLLDSQATPEEVCRSCPELLPEVRARWREICRVRSELDGLFPTRLEQGAGTPVLLPEATALPRLPGYEVEAVLGRGGMGVVYRARHLRLNRPVALKMLLAGPYAGPQELERFRREAEAVAGLRHPNVVQVYDIGDVDGRPYFTMELVEGGSLALKLAGAPLPALQAAALVAAITEAIQVAHQCGIVHRDLKPANVLLTPEGTPKVTDFGLARRLEGDGELTLSGAPLGTPSYMAPEQARGAKDAIGPATDVYALGAILYECLTGRPPFRADTATATVQQVVADEPVPPARLNPRVPRDLDTICCKCLEKKPEKRYRSAAELADDLGRFLKNEPVRARPLGAVGRAVRWARRRPALTVALAAGLLLALGLVGGGWWLSMERAQRRAEQERQRDRLRQGVVEALAKSERFQQQSRWAEARLVLNEVNARLSQDTPDDLRAQVDQTGQALDLAARLDAIRLNRALIVAGKFNNRQQANRDYQEALRTAGLGEVQRDPAALAARIQGSPVRAALLAALDDWAGCTSGGRQAWLLEVARRADPDPWRDRLRDPAAWRDRPTLLKLTAAVPVAGQPVALLVAVGERLRSTGGDATDFLRRVQQAHPGDFWANFTLGNILSKDRPGEAVGFYRAALALRPVAAAYNNLGGALVQNLDLHNANRGEVALDDCPDLDEAVALLEQALALDPSQTLAHHNLGMAWKLKGELDKAIACYRQALRLDPRYAPAHLGLGNALCSKDQLEEAVGQYQQALKIDPRLAAAYGCLGRTRLLQGRPDEALKATRRCLELLPPNDPRREDALDQLRKCEERLRALEDPRGM